MPRPALIAIVSFLLLPGLALAAPPRTPIHMTYRPGVLLVVTDDPALGAGPGPLAASRADVTTLLRSLGLDRATRLGPVPPAARAAAPRVLELASDRPDFDPLAAARALRSTGAFRAVCPDYRLSTFATTPNDAYYAYQWYASSDPAAVKLPLAWDVTHGDSSIVIAIMDTGIDTGHPDLSGKIWHNPGEIPGNGIDDDGNGYVDDVEGWDFGQGDADPNPEYTPDATGIDVGFHGTFVAGIAAAATDNLEGIAGAGWETKLMALKVSHPDSGITSSAAAGAFLYAADEGASIINMSIGGPGDPGVPEFFQALVDQATAAGALCVAAAGNDGDSTRTYPAACDGVLAVGATDDTDARASFSNYGSWVDLAAPGSMMWSSICRNYVLTDLDQIIYLYYFYWDGTNPYMYGDGTSFSCPLAAGVAALVRARFPALTPLQVAAHLVATGDVVAYDQPIGPRLDAYAAVATAPLAVAPGGPPAALALAAAPNPFGGETVLRFTLPAAGAARLEVLDLQGRRVRTLARGDLTAGPHAASWDGRDDRGVAVASGLYVVRLRTPSGEVARPVVRLDR